VNRILGAHSFPTTEKCIILKVDILLIFNKKNLPYEALQLSPSFFSFWNPCGALSTKITKMEFAIEKKCQLMDTSTVFKIERMMMQIDVMCDAQF